MSLKYQIDESEFGELDESIQSFYKQGKNGYVLDVDGVDTGDELKKALEHERKNRAEAREELERLRSEQTEAERKAAEEKGQFEELYKKTTEQLEEERKQAREFRQQIEKQSIQSDAQNISRQLAAKDAKRAEVLADYASRYAKLEDGNVVYEIGGVRMPKEKVAEHLKTEYPFLVDGSQASGGGAAGDRGGASDGKQVTRKDWDQMSHNDRASFAKDGGKIVDED